ncbi:MAG: ABC transporter ATP-binding protein [Acidisphaera sp.]|nr:ABC transporter ATP-binding protein [Acidisphaera sp.]
MTALLELHRLSRSFGGVKALQEVELTVPEGLVFALIGPNGAGKTTLINVLTGLLPPSAGRAVFRGRDLTGAAPHRVTQAGIARTFQTGRLFPRLSVTENVMTGGQHRLSRSVLSGILPWPGVRQAERRLRHDALGLLRRLGIESAADQPVGTLPYGRRRLVEIARALAAGPALLLLDEPAAGLNSREATGLIELLQSLKADGISTILIEHNMGLVMRVADRIAVLNFGRKIAEGTPAEIRGNAQVLEAYLGHGYSHA